MHPLKRHSLSIVVLLIFAIAWFAQAVAGRSDYNGEQRQHGLPEASFVNYLGTGHFWQATAENWESEFLQMACFIVLTAHLYQKGSPESKDPDKPMAYVDEDPAQKRDNPKAPWPVRKGGLALHLYAHSLSITMFALFLASWLLHAIAGTVQYNHEQLLNHQPPVTMMGYLASGRFWFESMQNWQSEFLSIAAMVLLGIFLREKGSPESKPVAMPHWEQE